ncbi:tetratricopeptide repeat protein [Rasiella rasia]|uniref:histidine kinase n=1 Tax=Rasiella rasia TaxID=2744027 RepID=A0A6G6GM61_9FLAO|nr:histidine kinase dimerization/phosphoacceptor domain -containing protein [Rasiella rasia]QIE59642.1 tetratricopeptide repeat protein [Rasiella rasia]
MKALFILLVPTILWSQDISEKERLKNAIDTTSSIPEKVQGYADLAWEYIITENDSALIYANKALLFSQKNKYPLGEAIALETKGLYHEIATGNYDLASTFYFDGIAVCETHNLEYSSSIYHSLGVMFHTSDGFEKALEYYTIAYEGAVSSGDLVLQKKCLINLGSVNSSLENFDKAESFMRESLSLDVRKEMDYSTYANLGYLYVKNEDFEQALPMLEKATEIHPDNPDSEINLYFLLHAKAELKDTTGMKPVLQRAKNALNTVVGLRDKSLLLRNLADYYKMAGDYKQALDYRDEYVTVFEEIKEKQRDETVYNLETQYQTEKTERELEKKEAAQKLLYWILGSTGLLLTAITFFFLKNRKKNALLAKQKRILEATVDEKNVLLKETHHRVKNSFQIVSSLLYLQSETIKDKEAKIAMQEAQNRVRSMVLIHQKLYSKDQLVGIGTKEYFTDLTNDIFESHQFEDQAIQYTLDVEQLVLDIETITPIGLILNELITNVIKHAFKPVTDISVMHIQFKKQREQLLLKVKDNGQGMSAEIKESSFGIQLIKALAKKLKATITFPDQAQSGTCALLEIRRFNEL